MSLDRDLVNLDEFAGSMNLSEESPRWIWMNESAEAGNEARKYLARFPYPCQLGAPD